MDDAFIVQRSGAVNGPMGPVKIRPVHEIPMTNDGGDATALFLVTDNPDDPNNLARDLAAELAAGGKLVIGPHPFSSETMVGLRDTIAASPDHRWCVLCIDRDPGRTRTLAGSVATELGIPDDSYGPEGPVRIRPFWSGGAFPDDLGASAVIWLIRGGLPLETPTPVYDELRREILARGFRVAGQVTLDTLDEFHRAHDLDPAVAGIVLGATEADAEAIRTAVCAQIPCF